MLSLAASVIAVIQVSREVVGICTELIENGSVFRYQAIEGAIQSLKSSVRELRDPLQTAAGSARTRDDDLVLDIANKCIATADDLQTTLRKLNRDPNGGFRDVIKKTIRAITKKKEIEQKRKDLDQYEQALNTRILTRILTRLDSGAVKSSQGIDQVLQRLTDLGISIASSNATTSQVVSDQLDRSTFSTEFIESIQFADIFSRQEQIVDAHRQTFEWIFRSPQGAETKDVPQWANFAAWLENKDGSKNIYWIYGKAGSGKSTLMSYLVDDERTRTALQA